MIAQDDGLAPFERVRDALALGPVEHDAGEVVEQRVVIEERARVLGERVEQASERRPRLAVDRVRVGGSHHVGTRLVQRRVDREGGGVDPAVTLDDLALRVHEDEVRHRDVTEGHAERVHPEVVEALGVARGDVPGDALLEPELGEETETGGEALLAVLALLLGGVVLREVPAGVAGGRLGSSDRSSSRADSAFEGSHAADHGAAAPGAPPLGSCRGSGTEPREALELDDVTVVGDEQAGGAGACDELATRPRRRRRTPPWPAPRPATPPPRSR